MAANQYFNRYERAPTRSTRLDADTALIDELRREDGDGIEHRVERHADHVYSLAVRWSGFPADGDSWVSRFLAEVWVNERG